MRQAMVNYISLVTLSGVAYVKWHPLNLISVSLVPSSVLYSDSGLVSKQNYIPKVRRI